MGVAAQHDPVFGLGHARHPRRQLAQQMLTRIALRALGSIGHGRTTGTGMKPRLRGIAHVRTQRHLHFGVECRQHVEATRRHPRDFTMPAVGHDQQHGYLLTQRPEVRHGVRTVLPADDRLHGDGQRGRMLQAVSGDHGYPPRGAEGAVDGRQLSVQRLHTGIERLAFLRHRVVQRLCELTQARLQLALPSIPLCGIARGAGEVHREHLLTLQGALECGERPGRQHHNLRSMGRGGTHSNLSGAGRGASANP